MEKQVPLENSKQVKTEFEPGSTVIYALHGRCSVTALVEKKLGENRVLFYKLAPSKGQQSKQLRAKAAIWVPVSKAKDQGLRHLMSKETCQEVLSILNSKEYYFDIARQWEDVVSELEREIFNTGGVGLAKVYSYLYVLERKKPPSHPSFNKLSEMVHRQLFRELSYVLSESPKTIEENIARGLRSKLNRSQ